MCLIFLSVQNHPRYKLIVAANRDEFYARRTEPAGFWSDHPGILGGRDLEAQGSWMGITRSGRISLITNYRDLSNINPSAPSRGKLVSDYLLDSVGPESYLQSIQPQAKAYNGFNLIAGTPDELWYFSNYEPDVRKIGSGAHGLSNHLLETPWPKVTRVKEKLLPLVGQEVVEPNQLLDALYDQMIAPDPLLPDTGIGLERERALSAMFIRTPNYGTRCSTVVLIDQENQITFCERTYNLKTFDFTTKRFDFAIEW